MSLEEFKRNQQILSTIATNGAVITREGVEKRKYRWVIEMPIISSYLVGVESAPRRSILTLTFVRAPTTQYPEGVAIDGWKEKGGGGG